MNIHTVGVNFFKGHVSCHRFINSYRFQLQFRVLQINTCLTLGPRNTDTYELLTDHTTSTLRKKVLCVLQEKLGKYIWFQARWIIFSFSVYCDVILRNMLYLCMEFTYRDSCAKAFLSQVNKQVNKQVSGK